MAATAILNFCLMATTRSLLAVACIGTTFDVKTKIRGISIEITKSWFLPARRCASAGLCDSDVSGRLSVTRRYCA